MNIENQPRRLIINRIVMENFKSYYGRLEIGPFHRKFTAIVGPNGSGKSNLIESLLFVFGKRANWMRLKSLHQLIHNSSSHSDIKKASVAVEFLEVEDRGSETIDIPNSKFTIKRTVQHTGQTHYSINEQHTSMEEVTSLLMSKGIDLTNNRFLILQGEVEQISVMKPKSGDPEKPGLIEYLEDIIGSSVFQEKIDKLIIEAEKLETMRRERGEVMRIVEGDLLRLEPAKNKAVEYVKREKQGMQLQSIQIQVGIFKLNSQRDKLYADIDQNEKVIAELQQQKKEFTKKNNEATSQLRTVQNEKQDLNAQHLKVKEDIKRAQTRDEDIRLEKEQISKEEHQLEKELKKLISKRSTLSDEYNDDQIELPKLIKQEENVNIQLQKINQEYKQLNQQHEDNSRKLLKRKKELENQIQDPLNKIKSFTQKIDFLKKQQAQLGQGQSNNRQIGQLEEKIKEQNQKINDFHDLIPKMEDVQGKIKTKISEHEEKMNRVQSQIRDLEGEAKQLRSQLNALQNEKQTQKEQERTVASILDATASGKLSGVIGRVGDLGWIPQKYDVAASNSCAGGLNAILVEKYNNFINVSEQAAKRCLDFLKQNRIGRCTFFSLNRVKETCTDFRRPGNMPPNCERLFDLVTPSKEEYRCVFWKVFNNTLVCDTIQTASELKFKKNINFRYVSLSGQIIETTNIMSGGGEPKQGLINTNANRQLNQGNFEQKSIQLRQKEEEVHQQIKQLQNGLNQEQNEYRQTQQELIQIQKLLQERKFEFTSLKDDVNDLSVKLQYELENAKRQDSYQQQKQQYARDIEESEKELYEEEQKCKNEKQEIEQIQKEINKQKSEELIKAKQELDTLSSQQEKLEDKIRQIQAQIKAYDERVRDLNQKIEQSQQQIVQKQADTQALSEEQTNIENRTIKLLGTQKALEGRRTEIDQIIDKFTKESASIIQTIKDFNAQHGQVTKKIEENKIEISRINEEAKNLDRRLDDVRRQYKDTLREYNFLGDLEEIANTTLGEQSVVNNNDFLNISILDETRLYDNKGQLIEEAPRNRRSGVAGQLQQIENYEVTQDLSPEELDQFIPIEKELQRALAHIQSKLNEARNEANIQDINSYKAKYDDFKEKKGSLDRVKEDLAQNKQQLEKVKRERYDMFMSGFGIIQSRLKETYQILTNGGDADLELQDTMDPFNEGVLFSVRPKNKTWKQMSKLSGGEKTLSSLSLIFALHHFRPTPLYFFDEVDAALDYRNVQIIGNFVKERTKNAQFIVISLRNNMFELADKLVGIYKTFDMTKTLQIQPDLVLQKVNARKENTGEDSENSRHLANQQ